jgi:hypothetical protein
VIPTGAFYAFCCCAAGGVDFGAGVVAAGAYFFGSSCLGGAASYFLGYSTGFSSYLIINILESYLLWS